ncbi:EMP24_GP25L domain-containing protein/Cellulose_synt domain-containing protein [Cephalotus follicularis]|uniref:EMP24_GP25L domain-containing protein/Cellulose_synt domain-containing protein n=1 Tax=Cephalotus follicularis TaxID=3775 RepID=A0A1Q3BLV1_CEPFO|nr:EMP24_GP25L domain-containing protein/Cellulose_synt domain-containing protein [Cephalotus follicularis]
MGRDGYVPLFETKKARGRIPYRIFAVSMFVAICLIWVYRVSHVPIEGENGRWVWFGLFAAELWFGFYWVLTQALRWNRVYRSTFKDRLSQRYENELPGVDIFVCTADPAIEPPMMVINTVLSIMAYNYPQEKLSVYLSDDAGSILTFYALLEASQFAKYWIPYCKKFNVEPRSPAAYFISMSQSHYANQAKDLVDIKKLYEDMKHRIENVAKQGQIPEEVRSKHKGFSQWDSYSSRSDHDSFLQILIDGRDPNATDIDGCALPTLVYLAREKRPQHHHNFKAGAMNALIRVSSKISNGQIILNVDCDMYSNNSRAVRDALCFFMDEEKGHEVAFVQFPQNFDNITVNEVYSSSLRVLSEVEFQGLDGYGGPLYVGTGCFHRRDTLCGRKFTRDSTIEWKRENNTKREESVHELEEKLKSLASCTYEENTQWGKEMGLKYGCPVEDVITGLSIQCRGWKSVYYNPARKAFLGFAPTTLPQTLVQHKRWSEGDFQILLSKFSPALYGHGKISLGLRLGYGCYCLWAPNCLATLYYTIIPSLYLLKGTSLFPQISSPWILPFVYATFAKYTYSLAEFLWSGGTVLGWWNDQRIWLYKRTSSYLFAFIDTILKPLGFSDSAFVITAKVADQDVSQRYKKEMMEFGAFSPMLTIIATISLLNLFCFAGLMKRLLMDEGIMRLNYETMALQMLLCGVLVIINWPLYQGLFLRKDKGKMPSSVTVKSVALAASAYMGIMQPKLVLELLAVFMSILQVGYGIRFVIDREECFSHKVEYEGDTVHASFVVIKADSSWHFSQDGVDLVVKGPHGDQIHDFRDKISEKFEFVARQKGVHRFCFTNKSPYHETIDFDVHVGHYSYQDDHAKDEHFNPLLEQISKLEEALYNIQFEQHWLEAQTEHQAIVNEAMSRRAIHKAIWESAALIGASVLQVYLLHRLFERKLGISRV